MAASTNPIQDALLDALLSSLPFLEDMKDDPGYKAGFVAAQLAKVRRALNAAGVAA